MLDIKATKSNKPKGQQKSPTQITIEIMKYFQPMAT